MEKQATDAANHILLDGWTIDPRSDVFAEKTIVTTCGDFDAASLPFPFTGGGALGRCNETSTLTARFVKRR